MKRLIFAALIMLSANLMICVAQQPDEGKTIEPVRSWSGKQIRNELLDAAPEKGWASNIEDWAKLWRAWRKNENLPAVDFAKNLVAICTTQTPNSCGIKLALSDAGDLKIQSFSTLIGGGAPTFNYQLVEFSRENVKTINGQSIGENSAAQNSPKQTKHYGLYGKIQAKTGRGAELAAMLLAGAKTLETARGCVLYVVGRKPDEPDAVYVFEVWESKTDHENSLKIPAVRELIRRAMPIIESVPGGETLEILGGKGFEKPRQ